MLAQSRKVAKPVPTRASFPIGSPAFVCVLATLREALPVAPRVKRRSSPFRPVFPLHFSASQALLSVCIALSLGASGRAEPIAAAAPRWFHWQRLASLPDSLPGRGTILASTAGSILVAGGAHSPDFPASKPTSFSDAILLLTPGGSPSNRWRAIGRLPEPLASAAVVPLDGGALVLGGDTPNGPTDHVFAIRWTSSGQDVAFDASFPPLPAARSHASAARIGDRVYLAGGRSANGDLRDFWGMELSPKTGARAWRPLPPWPGESRSDASLVAQSNGDHFCLYLLGGRSGTRSLSDAYCFDPKQGGWSTAASMPWPLGRPAAAAIGQSHVVAFGSDPLAYHTITDTWSAAAHPPVSAAIATAPWPQGQLVLASDASGAAAEIYSAVLRPPRRHLKGLDFAAMAAYLLLLAAIGLYFARREKSTEQFFLGGRSIPWWAAGLSLLATQVSSIGFMAVPAKSFATDWAYFAGVATWFLVVPIVTAVYIPLFRRLEVTSAYEYLEARFNLPVRWFGSAAYSALQLGRMAVVLYLPALALSAVTGLDSRISILTMGALCTLYTAAGGLEAVVWTDVLQAVILVGGALLCVVFVILGIEGGASRFYEIALADGKFELGRFDGGLTTAAIWVVLVGNFFQRLAGLTSDQAVVQRYLSTADKRQSIRALWTDVAASIPWAIIVFSLGTALYVYYKLHPERLSPAVDVDGVVPLFVAQQLPAGVSGVIIAAIFAAAMSSLDSSIHSTATVWVTDFYARLAPHSSDTVRLRLARCLTLALGVFATIAALMLAAADVRSLWDLFQSIVGLFAGGLAGLFILGLFTRRTNGPGALVGVAASAMVLYAAQPRVHFFLYPAVGLLGCVAAGYVAGFILPGIPKTRGLTVFDVEPTRQGQ